jgi:hypothetical protein
MGFRSGVPSGIIGPEQVIPGVPDLQELDSGSGGGYPKAVKKKTADKESFKR